MWQRPLTSSVSLHLSVSLPPDIEHILRPLLTALDDIGYAPSYFLLSQSFGNFQITFTCAAHSFSVVRDRGQFMLSGAPQQELEAFDLFRVFSTPGQMVPSVISWLSAIAG